MAKDYKIIKFFIITGIIILVDRQIHMSEIFINSIFNLHYTGKLNYLPIYASIGVILSSGLDIYRKILFSIGLFILYILIYIAFLEDISSKILLYIMFLELSIPVILAILLWKSKDMEIRGY